MPRYQDSRLLPYQASALFSLVSDVERYPEFLPGIRSITLLEKKENFLKASVFYGHKFLKGSYVCGIHLTPQQQIDIVALEGSFKHLTHQWRFHSESLTTTRVSFILDFELEGLIGSLLQPFLSQGAEMMIKAFEKRAHFLYRKA